MAANNLTFEQSAAFLTDLYEQASGKSIGAVTTANFVTVAQATLKTGYDNVISSISQVLSRTIFSVRPYSAKFKGLMVDNQRFGDIVRKINYVDRDIEDDNRLPLTDGASVDPWEIKKPEVLQTNWYGGETYQQHITIFRDQLDVAFSSAEEFGRFISGVMQNVADQLEQIREAEARAALVNFIAGKSAASNNVVNVLQEYYNETGVTLTPATMYADTSYVAFAKWLYAYVNRLSDMLAERTTKFHINVTGKEIHRHTPADRLKMYLSAQTARAIDSIALPSVYGADRLSMVDYERVVFWQSIDSPESINATPVYLATDGTLTTAGSAVSISNVMGVLFDEEALGLTMINQWMQSSGWNARGGYENLWYHFTTRLWNDFTENGIVLIADTVST